MKNSTSIFTSALLALSLVGCGGGSSDATTSTTTQTTTEPTLVTGSLVDAPISGVKYICSDGTTGTTNIDGNFTCPINNTITFSIGGVKLGDYEITSATEARYLFPSELFGLEEGLIDSKVVKFLQFVQSLDEDGNSSNGIQITQAIHDDLDTYALDFENDDVDNVTIENMLSNIGKTLVVEDDALEHYREELVEHNIEPLEPMQKEQWYIDDNKEGSIHANGYLDKYTGTGINVVVIDDGLDTTHEDLLLKGTWDVTTGLSDVNQTNSTDHHGTAVSGVIGGRINGKGIRGIAPDSNLYFIKYGATLSDSELITIFDKALEFNADVINCSWYRFFGISSAVIDKIKEVSTTSGRSGKGAVVVFGAGNDGSEIPIFKYEDGTLMDSQRAATIPEVITVGATSYYSTRAAYSNYGSTLDIVAPGGYYYGIATLDPMGANGVNEQNYVDSTEADRFVGTSAATPVVSGSATLILQANPNLTAAQVQEILKLTADKVGEYDYADDGTGKTRNDYYGYGKINLGKAIKMAEEMAN
ncbi:S8 family peptidase [Hydrogenimonas thermophila]|uniref:Subtilase family protein n=1 Tax=Hydrogenimonas thermophila TaxID=223786 RepID=A0A1I5UWP9_9BACT|nr:S8 family serine peptidase [Hydrogenimonas thermophila]SFP99764.1 Subtilase family protein [Hydrogenimonas thermophila]